MALNARKILRFIRTQRHRVFTERIVVTYNTTNESNLNNVILKSTLSIGGSVTHAREQKKNLCLGIDIF